MSQLTLWLAASLLLVPTFLYLTFRAFRTLTRRLEREREHAQQMSELHLATIEALALAIDAKDQTAHNRVRRVQIYATALARALGMSEEEVQAVKTAALLHDIGKLAVPEHILAKPGPLTPEEFQKVRIHPQIGAEIIGAVPFPQPVAPHIMNHHERWDGNGYPAGRKGEQVPLGARVLGIVEFYDALTSDRPYHKAITAEAAAALIEQESGKAFDPRVVETFLRMLPELRQQARQADIEARSFSLPFHDAAATGGAAQAPQERPRQSVFEDIAVAHREIYALYEIAQTMGTSLGIADTMALISSKLSSLVPFSSCALFLYDEDADALRCKFATGVESDVIGAMNIRSGQGL